MANMDKDMIDTMEAALEKAKNELSYATHLEDCGANAGIRKMNANKADWLSKVVYLAELGLEADKLLCEPVTMAEPEKPKTNLEKAHILFQMIKDNPVN
jgi:hypothetical protein